MYQKKGAGKIVFIKNFLEHVDCMNNCPFDRILLYYSMWQETYRGLGKNIEFHEGLPDSMDYSSDLQRTKLLILDDLLIESSDCDDILNLFTKGSHHGNSSVFFTTQNIFHKGKNHRDISLNSNYLVLLKNPMDKSQIRHLVHQLSPEQPLFVQQAYRDATAKPHGYLLVDLKQSTPENLRYRTDIFPHEALHQTVYVPININNNNNNNRGKRKKVSMKNSSAQPSVIYL